MNAEILTQIVDELHQALVGGVLGKIYQLSRASYVIDFRRPAGFLFLSTEASSPRIYLIRRTTKELEKQSLPLAEFGQSLRAILSGATVEDITKDDSERVVRFTFKCQQETGESNKVTLIAQLTGRSANLLLLDELNLITHAQRSLLGSGQQVGDHYQPPQVSAKESSLEAPFDIAEFNSLSAAADNYYQQADSIHAFAANAAAARNKLRQETTKLEKLRKHLQDDLSSHGDPEQHKRLGDLLMANVSVAERSGNKVRLKDFYAPEVPIVEIELDEKVSLQSEAAKYFARYGKAKRAAQQISERLLGVDAKLADVRRRLSELEEIIAERDEDALERLLRPSGAEKKTPAAKSKKKAEKLPGVRRYLSSDDYEVLVGRAAKDNDNLTFRIARSQDLWLHAADYPGSHVVVRNQKRKEIPHRTIIEAAQLAAKFSQAGNDAKVNVNYTPQKFVSRIKGAAPGLVRLASFRTITVEPKETIERF